MSSTPNFDLPLIPPSAADPSIPVNDALTKVDLALKDIRDDANPPEDGGYVPGGGSNGDVLTRTAQGYDWAAPTGGGGTDPNPDPGTGEGLPPGGTVGQVLTKLSNADGDADWRDPPSGGGGGGGGTGYGFSPPLVSTFPDTSVQFAGPITGQNDADVGLVLRITPTSGDRPSAVMRAVPDASWDARCRIKTNSVGRDFHSVGMAFNSAGTHLSIIGNDLPVNQNDIKHNRYTKNSSGGYQAGPIAIPNIRQFEWFRTTYNKATNIYTFYLSMDGKNWVKVRDLAESDFQGKVTAVGLGFGMNFNSPDEISLSCPYWSFT